jgi:hypothetical protein
MLLLFLLALALDAQGGHGPCLEPGMSDLLPAFLAFAEAAVLNTLLGFLDFLDQFTLAVSQAQGE